MRCCADDTVVDYNCAKSAATCGELGWSVTAQGFCPENTVYTCERGAGVCHERMARPCTAEELEASASGVAEFSNTTVVQRRIGHDSSDKCMCCADSGVHPDPCIRPHRIQSSRVNMQYSFEVETTDARQCFFVFDGCAGDEGVHLKFREATVDHAVPGDGWKIFAAISPVDLLSVQKRQYSRESILAEIRDTDSRVFRRTLASRSAVTMLEQPHGQILTTGSSEYLVLSPHSAIVEMKIMAKSTSAFGAFARFSVDYKCGLVTSGCMDPLATNFALNISYENRSACIYPPSISTTASNGFVCTRHGDTGPAECACVVSSFHESGYDASTNRFVRRNDPFEALAADYEHNRCESPASSTTFISHVNDNNQGLFWLRFSGTSLYSDAGLRAENQTLAIEGISTDTGNSSTLPDWNGGKIDVTRESLGLIRRIAIRNKVAIGNAAVATVRHGSALIMHDVLIENNMATGYHGAVWCHEGSVMQHSICDFWRVSFVGNMADENGALGSWSSMRVRESEFRDNWSIRGSAMLSNRARQTTYRSCDTPADCDWLDSCIQGKCEIQVTVLNSSFTNNVAQGDFGGALATGTNGFDVSVAVFDSTMDSNYAPLYGSAVASLSSDQEESRPIMIKDCRLNEPDLSTSSVLYLWNNPDFILHTVDFAQFRPNLVASNRNGKDCDSMSEIPCPVGSGCLMKNESIRCVRCPPGRFSNGRDICRNCRAGYGPTMEQDSCDPCKNDHYSASGVCKPCPSELIVSETRESCVGCPSHQQPYQTAVVHDSNSSQSSSPTLARQCGCESGFVDVRSTFFVCFRSGFDPVRRNAALQLREDTLLHNFCQRCPVDESGVECLDCNIGNASIAAGFTVPRVDSGSLGSRRLLAAQHVSADAISLFKCHRSDPQIARKRCPSCSYPPCDCGVGYTGVLCGSCAGPSELYPSGFGMTNDGECELCESKRPVAFLLLFILGGCAVAGGVIHLLSRLWNSGRIESFRYLVKISFIPTKSIVVYFQVMTQLGTVLDFTYPGWFGNVIDFTRPFFSSLKELIAAFDASECYGVRDHQTIWLAKAFGIPVLMILLLGLECLYYHVLKGCRRQQNVRSNSNKQAKETNIAQHAGLAIFICYPGFCKAAFDALICKDISASTSVLLEDNRVMCEDPEQKNLQLVALVMIGLAIVLPTAVLFVLVWHAKQKQEQMREHCEALKTRVSQAMCVPENRAEGVITDLMSSSTAGMTFITEGYTVKSSWWEAVDMYRKLGLIGVVMCFQRGSVGQIYIAVAVAIIFLLLQISFWPYKMQSNNQFRTATEAHVFITLLLALVLKHPLNDEEIPREIYEDTMFWLFVLLVPFGFLITVIFQQCHIRQVLRRTSGDAIDPKIDCESKWIALVDTDDNSSVIYEHQTTKVRSLAVPPCGVKAKHRVSDDRHMKTVARLQRLSRAFHLCSYGLADHAQRILVRQWLCELEFDQTQRLDELSNLIEGRANRLNPDNEDDAQQVDEIPMTPLNCYESSESKKPSFHWTISPHVESIESAVSTLSTAGIAATSLDSLTEATAKEEQSQTATYDDPFAKFSGGFEGTYGDIDTFYGGLVQLIGEPDKQVDDAVRAEHCEVLEGFGASKTEMQAGNYGVKFTPEKEYNFVADPDFLEPMDCGLEWNSGEPPISGGYRQKMDIRELTEPSKAVPRIRAAFSEMGWPKEAVSESRYKNLKITTVELIAMRLYTGPCFVLYNGVLRTMASGGIIAFGFPPHLIGKSVNGRFTTTLHAINSGVIKVSRLQPKCIVYRGMHGIRLPKSFTQEDDFGFKSGVEYGFMSTTTNRSVAEQYSRSRDPSEPSMIFEMELEMVNRGAFLKWLSQYPDEQEILFPPLTGLEVVRQHEESVSQTNVGSRLIFVMQLNVNMQSMTIEEVLAQRRKQCLELATIIRRDLSRQVRIGDIPQLQYAVEQQQKDIEGQDPMELNKNSQFVHRAQELLRQLPQLGDQLNIFKQHSQPISALVSGRAADGNSAVVISGSWDGKVLAHGQDSHREVFHSRSAVLALALLNGGQSDCNDLVAIGKDDGFIEVVQLGCGTSSMSIRIEQDLAATELLPVTALAWLPEKQWLACGASSVAVVFKLNFETHSFEECWRQLCDKGPIRGLCWTVMDAQPVLATSSLQHGEIKVWEISDCEPSLEPQLRLSGHQEGVTALVHLGKQEAREKSGQLLASA
eukprot:SAG31_NODE_994_length_10499_cov_6.293452_6_plen_2190_part_01